MRLNCRADKLEVYDKFKHLILDEGLLPPDQLTAGLLKLEGEYDEGMFRQVLQRILWLFAAGLELFLFSACSRGIKAYALSSDDDEVPEERRMKGVPKRVVGALPLSAWDAHDEGGPRKITSSWALRPTGDLDMGLTIKSRILQTAINAKRRSIVRPVTGRRLE